MDDGDKFAREGHTFRVNVVRDEDMGEPWKEHDGYGIVSDWTHRKKRPGERVLVSDGRTYGGKRFYDVRASMELARKDGWGCGVHAGGEKCDCGQWHKTQGEVYVCAVNKDFKRLRAWCNDEWWWVGVVVTMLDDKGAKSDLSESLWGIESDMGDYLDEVAEELADQIIHQINKELSAWRIE